MKRNIKQWSKENFVVPDIKKETLVCLLEESYKVEIEKRLSSGKREEMAKINIELP